MKLSEKPKVISALLKTLSRVYPEVSDSYPKDVLDLVVLHHFHFYMTGQEAYTCFQRLKSHFVDWNEVRVSTLAEIQRELIEADDPLELALFLKQFLTLVQQTFQRVSLEVLVDFKVSEIRRFFRVCKDIRESTVALVLRVRKGHPIVPLDSHAERIVSRLGLVPKSHTLAKKQRYLNDFIPEEMVVPFHLYSLQHGRYVCIEEEDEMECNRCSIRSTCDYYARQRKPRRRSAKK